MALEGVDVFNDDEPRYGVQCGRCLHGCVKQRAHGSFVESFIRVDTNESSREDDIQRAHWPADWPSMWVMARSQPEFRRACSLC